MKQILQLAVLVLIVSHSQAQTVRGWQTSFDDGDARERKLGLDGYGVNQDQGYDLLTPLAGLTFTESDGQAGTKIKIDPTRRLQTIVGLGGALTDSSAFLLSELKAKNPELYTFVMRQLFSEEGAGFRALRRPMGSSDFTATKKSYTYADVPSEDLSTFSIAHDRRYIIPMLKEILAINPKIFIIGSPWSAPAWMKGNGDLYGVTGEQKESGIHARLKPEYFGLYADYFLKFLQAYAAEGITVQAVTLQNEPQFDWAGYPCMRMTVEDQIAFVRALGPKLKAAALDTQIFVHDHNWTLHDVDRGKIGGDQKLEPLEVATRILRDPIAGPFVTGTAWHCYAGDYRKMREVYSQLLKDFPNKLIYTTEATGWRDLSRPGWAGDCFWGLRHNWLGSLQAGAGMSLQWNLILDHKHGPTTRTDSKGVGLVTLNTDTWESVRFEREYYAMAHVSKAIGHEGVHVHSEQSPKSNLLALAVARADGATGLVVGNPDGSTQTCQVIYKGKQLTLELPARSLVTLVW